MNVAETLRAHARYPPFEHQVSGVETLLAHPYFLLADDMGAGKSKQTIDYAQILAFVEKKITKVVVIAPAPVRDVWFDPEMGQLADHLWKDYPSHVVEYHVKQREWSHDRKGPGALLWIITNYDYIRREAHLKELLAVTDRNTLLVLDESSAVKRHNSDQTKACWALRWLNKNKAFARAGRIVLLNGTPIADDPEDMYAQGVVMHPSILDCRGITHYRARYAVMNSHIVVQTRFGSVTPVVEKWVNLEDLQRRFAPYVLRRLKKDCLDLPEKLPPVTLKATLKPDTWRIYQSMKKEMVAWFETGMATADAAMIQSIRLAQITSGFVGGLEFLEDSDDTGSPPWLSAHMDGLPQALKPQKETQEVGREKIDLLIEWLKGRFEENSSLKVLVWSRFREEVFRAARELAELKTAKPLTVGTIVGGQPADERRHALRILDPRFAPEGPVVVVGTASTGSMGLNLTAASAVVYLSNDYNLKTRLQSEDRCHRPGQVNPVSYFDVIAVGPKGQKTIDEDVVKALRAKDDMAKWVTSAWVQRLREDGG